MRADFYPRLAADSIRKNRQLYIPYIFIGSVMVMIFYIMSYLMTSPALKHMPHNDNIEYILALGTGVIGFFSLIFLFYTNSFLVRQRNREFGLYNILGMDKRNIRRIIIWESLGVGFVSIIAGLFFGIVLSKLAELGLLNLLHLDVSYELSIDANSLIKTLTVYGVIYLIMILNSLVRVCISKPLELLQSNRVGEKPPKNNMFFGVLGAVILITAYTVAVNIKNPLTALSIFFVAVILVIAATYLLFISGSVTLCRILQKNKKYYYKQNHFVSVSSMVYRMKRNGAGLASICILLTMVLVMISSSASLYFGMEDSIRGHYPHNINISVNMNDIDGLDDNNISYLCDTVYKNGGDSGEMSDYRYASVSGMFTDTGIIIDADSLHEFKIDTYENVGTIYVISLSDYNRLMKAEETLEDNECMIYCRNTKYKSDTFAIADGEEYNVKKVLNKFFFKGIIGVPTMCIVVKDIKGMIEPFTNLKDYSGKQMMQLIWDCGIDMDAKDEADASEKISSALWDIENKGEISSYFLQSREDKRSDFFTTYGSVFFLGIVLSMVFLLAAVLIIYYKQISEGYEDRSRFEIMQKIGMTKKDIHKSINSQMLTVFFMPLVFAGMHLGFAFPLVWKILQLFALQNLLYVVIVTIICFVVFGLFYTFVYKITSNVYCSIVSGSKEK